MTTKSEFNADGWGRVAQAPALAALMVMVADRGGAIRESIALGKAYAAARGDGGSELMKELVSTPPQRIQDAVRTVEQKATPEEAEEYRSFILRVADVVAHAAKEGGVLGIGGKEVSEQEQAALDELAGKLSAGTS